MIVRGSNNLTLRLYDTFHQLDSGTHLRDYCFDCSAINPFQDSFVDNLVDFINVLLGGADYDLEWLVFEPSNQAPFEHWVWLQCTDYYGHILGRELWIGDNRSRLILRRVMFVDEAIDKPPDPKIK